MAATNTASSPTASPSPKVDSAALAVITKRAALSPEAFSSDGLPAAKSEESKVYYLLNRCGRDPLNADRYIVAGYRRTWENTSIYASNKVHGYLGIPVDRVVKEVRSRVSTCSQETRDDGTVSTFAGELTLDPVTGIAEEYGQFGFCVTWKDAKGEGAFCYAYVALQRPEYALISSVTIAHGDLAEAQRLAKKYARTSATFLLTI